MTVNVYLCLCAYGNEDMYYVMICLCMYVDIIYVYVKVKKED